MIVIETLGRILLVPAGLGFALGGFLMMADVLFDRKPNMFWLRVAITLIMVPSLMLILFAFAYGIVSP